MRFIFLFCVFFSFSQNKQSFYFDFDQSTFNLVQENDFQNWLNVNSAIEIKKIEGYCDFVGTNSYNKQLASKRIAYVLKKIKNQELISKIIITKSYGEDFDQDSIQSFNRRVDVYYENKKIDLDEFLSTNASGKSIILKSLNFYNNSGEIIPASQPVLKELLDVMNKYPKLKIDIQGHICCQSIEEAEKIEDIAKVRALAIYTYLSNNGIEKDRLSYQSFKSTKPLFSIPEQNEEERNANRRVEIMIIEN